MKDDEGPEILAYLHSFDPGGVERTALRLCAAWQADGAQVKVLMGRGTGVTRASAPQLDYIVYPSVLRTAPFETLWMIHCLWTRVRAVRPDVIFCAGNSYTVVAVALRLLLGRSCPPIVAKVSNALDRRDMPRLGRPFYRLWLRIQARLIARWVAIAPGLDGEIAALMRVPRRQISIIADPAISPVEAAALAASRAGTREASEGRLFLAAGRLARQKRFDLLIDAFARARGRLIAWPSSAKGHGAAGSRRGPGGGGSQTSCCCRAIAATFSPGSRVPTRWSCRRTMKGCPRCWWKRWPPDCR